MEVDHVATFLAIVRHGGFTRASEVLHVSQPAISRRIRLLETELGAPLFERGARGVLLTEAGRSFLPYAETLATVVQDGLASVSEVHGGRSGEVTLAFIGTLAGTDLTDRLREFRDASPEVRFRIRTAPSDVVSDLVRRGEATLGLRYAEDTHPDLVSTTIGHEELLPVAPAGHPLLSERDLAPERLARYPWITFPARPGEPRQPYADALETLLGRDALEVAEIVPIDSLTAQVRMVEAGFGLAVLPRSGVGTELSTGRLRVLDVPRARFAIPVVLVQRRAGFLSGAAQALRTLLLSS
ncbi:LysR family transcriptional regulator [Pseudonocardia spinosispora]|uniref:LysR family transcriptional regulator n=1 Tax=Pseudonocardia spinosispora TaxID=103441 RepID=UPI000427EF6F|nr:LysR family transcriptional regulator [Pseudonocardia spinosispora]